MLDTRAWAEVNITPQPFGWAKRCRRHVKDRPDQTRTGQVSPPESSTTHGSIALQVGSTSGDPKTLRVLGICFLLFFFFFDPKFSGHLFGHFCSSVSHTTGTRNMNTLAEQWTNFQCAQDRSGQRQKRKPERHRQLQIPMSEHSTKDKIVTHVMFLVECRTFANVWRTVCCPRGATLFRHRHRFQATRDVSRETTHPRVLVVFQVQFREICCVRCRCSHIDVSLVVHDGVYMHMKMQT